MLHLVKTTIVSLFPKRKERTYNFLTNTEDDMEARRAVTGYLLRERLVTYEDELTICVHDADREREEVEFLKMQEKIITL